MNNQHMKIQMHKWLEKSEHNYLLVCRAGSTASPPTQVITKLLPREEQSDNF